MSANPNHITYHRISKPRCVNVIICEPAPGEYVWMSMYLRPGWRNGQLSKEIVRYILHLLPGTHLIDFFPQITSIRELAREDDWLYQGASSLYHGCISFQARSPRTAPPIAPLLRGLLSHTVTHRRPWLPTFKGAKSARQAVRRITRRFGCLAPNGEALATGG